MTRGIEYSDWPTVSDGMLYFRDDDQYVAYNQFLDSLIAIPETNTDTTMNDPDDILESLESGLGFVSLRHNAQAAFDAANEIGWNSLEEIPEVHFINSITTRSTLNANADVRIGDTILHYISKDFSVAIPASETSLLDQLHSLSTSATSGDITALDPLGEKIKLQYWTVKELGIGTTLKGTGTPGVLISDFNITQPNYCNQPLLVNLDNIRMADFGTPVKTDYHIDWGDGTSTNATSNSNVNNAWLNGVLHNYGAAGTYTIKIYGRINNGVLPNYNPPYDDDIQKTVVVPMSCVTGISRTQGSVWHYDNMNMNRAFWGKVWVEHYGTSSNPKHKIGALTESYHLESNKWRLSRIDRVVVQFSTTKHSAGCAASWGDNGAAWPYNSRKACDEHKNKGQVSWDPVWANHRIVVGSNVFAFSQYMNPCP